MVFLRSRPALLALKDGVLIAYHTDGFTRMKAWDLEGGTDFGVAPKKIVNDRDARRELVRKEVSYFPYQAAIIEDVARRLAKAAVLRAWESAFAVKRRGK